MIHHGRDISSGDMERLPDDILCMIFTDLQGRDVARLLATCRRWNSASTRPSSLWHDIFMREFKSAEGDFARHDNAGWRTYFRQHWWRMAWLLQSPPSSRRRREEMRRARSSVSEKGLLRLLGLLGVSTFVFVNIAMNLWNMEVMIAWHSFIALSLWMLFCVGLVVANQVDVADSWSRLLMFGGVSSAFCLLVLSGVRAIAGPASVPQHMVAIAAAGCGLFGLVMIVMSIAACRTPFVPASLRGRRAWLLE